MSVSLPVTMVMASGAGFKKSQLRDQVQYNVRNQLATIGGASVPPQVSRDIRLVVLWGVGVNWAAAREDVHYANDSK